jgi:hypothetical protein
MTLVRSRALAVLLALAPGAALLVGSPAQAAAPSPNLPTVKSVAASKTAFVLGAKAACSKITFTAVLSAVMPTEGYEYTGVGVDLFAPGKSGDDSYDGVEFAQVGSTTTYRGAVNFCGKYAPGAWHAEVYGAGVPTDATDESDVEYTNIVKVGISLKRPTTLAFNASPEPVKKGKKITAAGTLKLDGKVLPSVAVKIYFKATGAKAYTLKSTVTTSKKGAFSKKYTASKSGTWKAVYAGTSTRNTVTTGDAVKVN